VGAEREASRGVPRILHPLHPLSIARNWTPPRFDGQLRDQLEALRVRRLARRETLLGMVCIPAWAADLRRYDSKSRRDQDPLRSGGSSAHHSGITRSLRSLASQAEVAPCGGPPTIHTHAIVL